MDKNKLGCALVSLCLAACGPEPSSAAAPDDCAASRLALEDEVSHFAVEAQALLGGYHVQSLAGVTNNTSQPNKAAFLRSKPSVEASGLSIHSYRPTLTERTSEYGQVWYKFKAPAAIDAALAIDQVGERNASEDVLELAFFEGRKLVPEAAAQVDLLGYTFTFRSENMVTGPQWASTPITIETRGGKEIYVRTPTLITSMLVPVVGGMHYMKAFAPTDAAQILVDLANGNHDRIPFHEPSTAPLDLVAGKNHNAYAVNWYGILGQGLSQKAVLFLDKEYEASGDFLGTYIISPGAYVPTISMRGLAKSIASRGYVVFVVTYFQDLAFWESLDFRKDSVINLALLIKERRSNEIHGLPPVAKMFYGHDSAPVTAFGHSLGGAALGPAIFGATNPLDSIVLYGVASYAKQPWLKEPVAENVSLFFGANEDKAEARLQSARNALLIQHVPDADGIYHSVSGNRTMQMIEGLSHFCIISDMNVGMSLMRNADGEGPAPSQAVQTVVDHLKGRGLL